MKVRLAVRNGDLVKDVEISPFLQLPEVVVWGERIFALSQPVDLKLPVYLEAFTAYVVP